MPNRYEPIGNIGETLLSRSEETVARLEKIRDAGYKVVSILGYEFKKLWCNYPGLENELSSHPYVKNSPINIRDALYGDRTEATKTWYRTQQGEEIHYVNVISLYPYHCKYGKFPVDQPKVCVGADCPPTAWIGRGLSDVTFCLLGSCIIQYFRIRAIRG
jgi:hypothetical protein